MKNPIQNLSDFIERNYSERSFTFMYEMSGIASVLNYQTGKYSLPLILIAFYYVQWITYPLAAIYTIFSGNFNLTIFEIIDVLTGVFPAISALTMVICSCCRPESIQLLNTNVLNTRFQTFQEPEDKEIIRNCFKKSNMFIFCYMVLVYMNILFWLIRPLLSNELNVFNIDNEGEIIYKILDCYYPFDHTATPTYYFVILYEAIGVYNVVTLYLVTDSLFSSMVIMFSGQMEVLKRNIDTLKINHFQSINRDEPQKYRLFLENKLKSIIMNHQKLISLFQVMKIVFNPIIILRMGGSGVSVCIILFKMNKASPLNTTQTMRDIVYLATHVTQMLMYPFFGNKLKQMSLDLNESLYETDWNIASRDYKRAVILMMARAQRPLCFKVMGLMDLDMVASEYAIKLCYTYYTILRTISSKGIDSTHPNRISPYRKEN